MEDRKVITPLLLFSFTISCTLPLPSKLKMNQDNSTPGCEEEVDGKLITNDIALKQLWVAFFSREILRQNVAAEPVFAGACCWVEMRNRKV